MKKQHFKISIEAPREKVWDVLWNDKTYRQWTAAFHEGSRAETDWKKGSKVLFLGEENEGMVATIDENIPNEYMSIRHLGFIKDGVEDTQSKEIQEWIGAKENYRLESSNGKTELVIDTDITDAHYDYFLGAWPKALDKVKELAENR